MRTAFDFSPLYRSTVGFDRLFDILDQTPQVETTTSWPPYNIEKVDTDHYRIVMAVAGFSPDEIELVQQDTTLIVSGQKHPEDKPVQILHRGIPARTFKQSFNLADYVQVKAAKLENGLLTLDLVREVPEEMRPKRIRVARGNGSKIIEHEKA
ncbi:Hsp20 family protein [Microvirga arsenatis]|uniref:Hsp20 family protein n=1 Tax=Microvirga arsenatis TaxID=2692265 RepID=A0ABW9Z7X6_9HYPH|nr:Hsp20 family protein [Microvirga arsenatis]NBJ13456.1 Hsp20 family protein [Microvirga arsenatis]NBJ27006.1 Hsp20 family protein [Microvirga arsenatis]